MKTIIKVICCVCKKYLGEKDGEGIEGISHGYCPDCFEKEMRKIRGISFNPEYNHDVIESLIKVAEEREAEEVMEILERWRK